MDMRAAEIELQIDELVLHGFAAGDRRRIGRALERELARLLAHGAAGGAIPRALTTDGALAFGDGGVVHLAAGASPEVAGAQVAQAVYRAISGSTSAPSLPRAVASTPAHPTPEPPGSAPHSSGVAAPRGAKR
jgi:hypothetical protein